jgi:hypothetical protein
MLAQQPSLWQLLQDIEAAAATAQQEAESASGSTAGRQRRRCDLWWLLALPAAVMLLLAARVRQACWRCCMMDSARMLFSNKLCDGPSN